MADNSAFFREFDALIERMNSFTNQTTVTQIERKGLEAVLEVAVPAMVAATPVQTGQQHGTSLAKGELKASVRGRILPEKDGLPQAAVVDFGKNNFVADFVDRGTSRAPANPFVRRTIEGTRAACEAAFVEEATEEIRRQLAG